MWSQINDIGMEPVGDHLRGLRVLRLGHCVQISDAGLEHLAGEIMGVVPRGKEAGEGVGYLFEI
jgi:hypothetical protein